LRWPPVSIKLTRQPLTHPLMLFTATKVHIIQIALVNRIQSISLSTSIIFINASDVQFYANYVSRDNTRVTAIITTQQYLYLKNINCLRNSISYLVLKFYIISYASKVIKVSSCKHKTPKFIMPFSVASKPRNQNLHLSLPVS
jgi:hypothetical protein